MTFQVPFLNLLVLVVASVAWWQSGIICGSLFILNYNCIFSNNTLSCAKFTLCIILFMLICLIFLPLKPISDMRKPCESYYKLAKQTDCVFSNRFYLISRVKINSKVLKDWVCASNIDYLIVYSFTRAIRANVDFHNVFISIKSLLKIRTNDDVLWCINYCQFTLIIVLFLTGTKQQAIRVLAVFNLKVNDKYSHFTS